jgi:glyoxalase superfamily protein
MALRWYTVVVDCLDVAAQAEWWRETLGWQKIYEADDEVVIVPAHVTEELARSTPWEQVGPGLVFVPVAEPKRLKNPSAAPSGSSGPAVCVRDIRRNGSVLRTQTRSFTSTAGRRYTRCGRRR